jgi:CSLREA domain-containing protein
MMKEKKMKREFIITILCFGFVLCGGFFAREAKVATRAADSEAGFNSSAVASLTFTVNSLANTGDSTPDGACSNGAGGTCTLREAIEESANEPGMDTINIAVTGTINLTGSLFPSDVQINGPGAGSLTVRRNTTGSYSVFVTNGTVTLSGLTISNGKNDINGGGAIDNSGTVNINNCTVSSNQGGAVFTLFGVVNISGSTFSNNTTIRAGGGVNNYKGALNITGNTFTNNSASGSSGGHISTNGGTTTITGSSFTGATGGGAIYNTGAMTITGSTISNNANNASALAAGGITNESNFFDSVGNLSISNSTISGNSAQQGGGIRNMNGATLNVSNSTISGNLVSNGFGGILNKNSTATLRSVTVANNQDSGIYKEGSGTVTLHNTIVWGNNIDIFGGNVDAASSYNLVGFNSGGLSHNVNGNQVNVNPLLGALAPNGAATQTHSLPCNSAAINRADPNHANVPATDQRNIPRPAGLRSDVGAFESIECFPTVSNADNSGTFSLRGQIQSAPTGSTIYFSPAFFNQPRTITLTTGEILINKNLTIGGTGADSLTIDANNQSRIFNINVNMTLTLSGVKLTRGSAAAGSDGGCVYSSGAFNLVDSAISDCSADNGGAVYGSSTGTLNIVRSTLSDNQARNGSGGGIFNNLLTYIYNSTVSGNTANGKGGGIYNIAPSNAGVYATNVTITKNSGNFGGGVFNESGTNSFFSARNTIFAGNTFTTRAPDFDGGLCSQGNNLIGNTDWTGISCITTGNLTGVAANLAPLGNYGGATQTHALLQNSPALNAGSNCVLTANGCGDGSAASSLDQRGSGSPRKIDASVDIGAFERSIVFNQSALPNASTGAFYSQTLSATRQANFTESGSGDGSTPDNLAPFTYSLVPVSGQQLPPGLSLASGGTISGTPTQTGSYTFTVKAADTDGMASAAQYTMQIFSPTAATVSVSGRILTPDGRGLINAKVILTDAQGNSRTAISTSFGYYRFDEVRVGEVYILSVSAKRYQFNAQAVNVMEEMNELNLSALP